MSSRTPSDDFTPDLGSSFLLPDFEYAEDYNEGVLDEARLPEARGLAELPEGLVQADEDEPLAVPEGVERDDAEGFDLDALGLVASEASEELDLDALGVVANSGLPQPDTSESVDAETNTVPDIVDFTWLSDATQDPNRLPSLDTNKVIPELVESWGSRTDGITRVEGVRDLQEAQYQESVETDEVKLKFSNDELRSVLAAAMRRSASGVGIGQIKQEVLQLLGHEASRIAKPMKALEAEHGLVGNVYIRASAYPGLIHGKWVKHIKKTHKQARYLIACGQCDACRCGDHGACACNAQLGLQAVSKMDWNDAYKQYAPMLAATGRLDRTATVMDKRVALQHAFLRREEAPSLAVEQTFPTHKAPVQSVSREQALQAVANLEAAQREVLTNDDVTLASKRKKVKARLGHLVRADLLSKAEVQKLLASKAHPDVILKKAKRIITARHKEGEYRGDGRLPSMASDDEAAAALSAHAAEHKARQQAQKAAHVEGESVKQVEKMLRWTRQQMSEGMAGRDLTDLLSARWSGTLIKQATSQLVQIRKKHEGLAGHLYVDAAAYASPQGTSGCEKAASKHRANAVPVVLAMPRCASCTARSQREDGSMFCQKYGKPLVEKPPVEDPDGYQREQLRLANASDAEVTASLFNNPAAEFGLHNDVLDSFDVSEAPETSEISDYMFGGMEWSDE